MPQSFPLLRKHRPVPRALLIIEEYIPGALLGLTALAAVVAVALHAPILRRLLFSSVRRACQMRRQPVEIAGIARQPVQAHDRGPVGWSGIVPISKRQTVGALPRPVGEGTVHGTSR